MDRRTFLSASLLSIVVPAAVAARSTQTYDATTFPSLLAEGSVIVHVHAKWCPVCKAQEPALATLSREPTFSGVKFVQVDFDKDKTFLRAYRVANQSVILVFKAGKEVSRLAGVTNIDQLRTDLLSTL
jgi:thioredoxin 1